MEETTDTTRTEGDGSEERQARSEASREPVSVYDMISHTSLMFAELAFQRMGLVADPISGKVEQDMDQAKAAVDVAAFLAELVLPRLDERSRRELRIMVTNLRINFARQSQPGAVQE